MAVTTTETRLHLPLAQPELGLAELLREMENTPWALRGLQLHEWATQWHPTNPEIQSYALGILILRLQSLAQRAPAHVQGQIAIWGERLCAHLTPLLQEELSEFLDSCHQRLEFIAQMKEECDQIEAMFQGIEQTIGAQVTQTHTQMRERIETSFRALNGERRAFHTALIERGQELGRLIDQINENQEEAKRLSSEYNKARENLQNLIARADALLGGS